ncbi:MAG: hypothetical protein HY901_22990 [Deltaproteobacteria bacterium]|nr:hypothetical protein [Deltaproteobacteria bacterium]
MSKRKPGDGEVEDGFQPLGRLYEGEAALRKLLASAGSTLSVPEAADLFLQAQAEGIGADEVFPDLFDEEPHFHSASEARRLYSNLFGLWDRVAAGGPLEPTKAEQGLAGRREPSPAPEPIDGPLTDAFVEAAWKHLADLPQREGERWIHRWENTQPELTEALRVEAGEDMAVMENADTLAYELWAMFELARPGKRIRPVLMDEFQAALDATDMPEPALDRYIDEAVAEAALDEQQPLTEGQAKQVARIARAVVRSLARIRPAA